MSENSVVRPTVLRKIIKETIAISLSLSLFCYRESKIKFDRARSSFPIVHSYPISVPKWYANNLAHHFPPSRLTKSNRYPWRPVAAYESFLHASTLYFHTCSSRIWLYARYSLRTTLVDLAEEPPSSQFTPSPSILSVRYYAQARVRKGTREINRSLPLDLSYEEQVITPVSVSISLASFLSLVDPSISRIEEERWKRHFRRKITVSRRGFW